MKVSATHAISIPVCHLFNAMAKENFQGGHRWLTTGSLGLPHADRRRSLGSSGTFGGLQGRVPTMWLKPGSHHIVPALETLQ